MRRAPTQVIANLLQRIHWRHWSIKTRMILLVILPVAYLFGSVVLYSYYSRVKEAQEELQERGRIVTKALADGIEHNILSRDLEGLKWTINGVVQSDKSIHRIDVLDTKKEELVHVSSFSTADTDGTVIEAPITRNVIMVNVTSADSANDSIVPSPPSIKPDTLGYVRVTMSPTSLLKKQSKRFYFELFTSFVALAVSAWLALTLSDSVVSPLNIAIGALQKIRGGDYQTQLQVTTGGEIGDLQASINQMAISLAESKQDLENKVQQRTQELTASRNEALKADAEKRRLIHKINTIVEDERKSIAIEIHDELNASLIAARLESQRILHLLGKAESTPMHEEIKQKANAIIQLTLDLYANGRNLVRRLRPEVLDMLGLQGAIEDMLRSYHQSADGCAFRLEAEGDFSSLPNELAISAYRIVQEAVSNCVKHAKATEVDVTLHIADNQKQMSIEVNDNGKGFDPDVATSGIGLTGMRERVFALHGTIHLQSQQGLGTKLSIQLPL